jgi:hypothetical protein
VARPWRKTRRQRVDTSVRYGQPIASPTAAAASSEPAANPEASAARCERWNLFSASERNTGWGTPAPCGASSHRRSAAAASLTDLRVAKLMHAV